jgi:hypothetical protein
MSNVMRCPRRSESPQGPLNMPEDTDEYDKEDDGCSFCGSLSPEVLMQRLEAGDVEVVPTDKSYKIYVRRLSGAPFKQHYRNCPPDAECTGPSNCTHYTTREIDQTKFYFQHLSPEQQTRFIELHNTKHLKLGVPGYFYTPPFFCKNVQPH